MSRPRKSGYDTSFARQLKFGEHKKQYLMLHTDGRRRSEDEASIRTYIRDHNIRLEGRTEFDF